MSKEEAEIPEQPDPEDESVEQPKQPSSSGRALGFLSLLVGLPALALGIWLWWERTEAVDSALNEDVQAVTVELERLESNANQRLDELAAKQQSMEQDRNSELSFLRQELQALSRAIERDQISSAVQSQLTEQAARIDSLLAEQSELASRLTRLGERLEREQGVARELDRDLVLTLDLLEIRSLLAIGRARLELASDRSAALSAYRLAAARLAQGGDARSDRLRDLLSSELSAIESMPTGPDWPAIRARLSTWASDLSDWPLAEQSAATSPQQVEAADQPGWWNSVTGSLGRLVDVERRDMEQLDAADVERLKEALAAYLAAAELAAGREDTRLLADHAASIQQALERYFNIESARLQSVLDSLGDWQSLELPGLPEGLGRAESAIDQLLERL